MCHLSEIVVVSIARAEVNIPVERDMIWTSAHKHFLVSAPDLHCQVSPMSSIETNSWTGNTGKSPVVTGNVL